MRVKRSFYHAKIKVGIGTLILLTIFYYSNAQVNELPLTGSSTNIQIDSCEIHSLINRSVHIRHENLDSAIQLLNTAKTKSFNQGYYDGVAYSMIGLATISLEKGNYTDAKKEYELAWYYCQKATVYKTNLIALWYQNMAINYAFQGLSDSSYFYLQKSLNLARNHKDSNRIRTIYLNIGTMWAAKNDYFKAIYYLEKAKNYVESTTNLSYISTVYNNLAVSYGALEDTAQMRNHAEKGLYIATKAKNNKWKSQSLLTLGSYYIKTGKTETAIVFFKEGLKLCEGGGAYPCISPNLHLSKAYLILGQKEKAIHYGRTALRYAEQTDLKDRFMADLYQHLAELYKQSGVYDKAYYYKDAYANLSDELNQTERNKALDEMEMRYQSIEQTKKLSEKELLLTKQSNQLKNQQILLGFGIAIVVIIIMLFAYFYIKNRHKQLLLEKAQEINELKATITGEEKERTRIARELHDGIASQLTSVRLTINHLRERGGIILPQELDPLMEQIDESALDLRKASHNLIPDALKEHGLATAVQILCDKTEKNTNLDVTCEVFNTVPRVDADAELTIYRITQELIQNSLKHAHASSLLVQLSYRDHILHISVEDDGNGIIDEDNDRQGSGLKNIKERIKILNGIFTLESETGKGTAAYIECDWYNK